MSLSIIPRMDTSGPPFAPQDALRRLPSVDHVLNHPTVAGLPGDYPRAEVVAVVRAVLEERRRRLLAGEAVDCDPPALALDIRRCLQERSRPHLRRVINATGIVLHTGLGRAPLADEALAAISEAAAGYCNLELDLATGERGDRYDHARDLLRELTGAEDALVVNNNAGATYLVLSTLAADRDVVVSRGQLVEIGGQYRLPDIMAAARCRLVEVGTTNRTRIEDYERALSERTALLLHVHPSNYRVVGFAEAPSIRVLAALAQRHGVLAVDDLGSGLLHRDLPWPECPPAAPAGNRGPRHWDEPCATESLAAGAALALFSGDKLLGGPQAGVIIGRADLVAAVRRNPLTRALRPDKLTLAALEATLRLYRDPAVAVARVPSWRLLSRPAAELARLADGLARGLRDALPGATVRATEGVSEAGGGSLATIPFATWLVQVRVPDVSVERLAAELRQREVPVIARLRDDMLVLDVRTLEGADVEVLPAALAEAWEEARR